MTDLATEIETSEPTLELADKVLIACGWRREEVCAPGYWPMSMWVTLDGETLLSPNPLTDLNAIAELERGADVTYLTIAQGVVHTDRWRTIFKVRTSILTSYRGEIHAGESDVFGPHAEPRARSAALIRALTAAGRMQG